MWVVGVPPLLATQPSLSLRPGLSPQADPCLLFHPLLPPPWHSALLLYSLPPSPGSASASSAPLGAVAPLGQGSVLQSTERHLMLASWRRCIHQVRWIQHCTPECLAHSRGHINTSAGRTNTSSLLATSQHHNQPGQAPSPAANPQPTECYRPRKWGS